VVYVILAVFGGFAGAVLTLAVALRIAHRRHNRDAAVLDRVCRSQTLLQRIRSMASGEQAEDADAAKMLLAEAVRLLTKGS